jgi:alanine racemase
MKYLIADIAEILKAENVICNNQQISVLLTDSRSLFFPDESLFFALRTERNDGHKYINDLYKRGLRNFVVSDRDIRLKDFPESNFIIVDDTLQALQRLAEHHRNMFVCPVIAITGSNGKTIVKEWLWQLLREDLNIERSPRSYNSQTGVPLSLWQIDENTQLGIFEAGISLPGEMQKLAVMIKPDLGIFTNIGESHQENFESYEQKAKEKAELFRTCRKIIYCKDQDITNKVLTSLYPSEKLFSWSVNDKDSDVYVCRKTEKKIQLEIEYIWKNKSHVITLPFSDYASFENAMQCLSVLLLKGVSEEIIASRMLELEPVAMRLEVKEGKNGCVVINDSYNSDVNALELALDFQARRSAGTSLKRTLILSDILQSGKSPEELYTVVSDLIKRKKIDLLIGIGLEISSHAYLFDIPSNFFLKTERLLASGLLDTLRNQSVLIKGSRSFGFEEISERLALKVHETVLEVNLDAIVHNLNYFRSCLKPETKIIAMVKAAGYGSGSLEIARTLQTNSCDIVAVAVADEGVELRHGGITMPIIVMNPEFGSFATIFEHKLEPEIYSFKLLQAFINEAEREGIDNYPIHIKLDTGMHRLGFEEDDLPELLELLKGQESLRVRSVFSHLAGSDEEALDYYTEMQLERFERMSDKIQAQFSHRILKHVLNSAGIERYPEYQHDMVRLGIGLYGISAVNMEFVRNVSTLKTTILQIRSLKSGQSVGYGRKGMLYRDSIIATLPIGYADGLDRHLGNGNGEVLINGKRAPLVGNVCMDACMVDVTDIIAEEGDEVIIFGDNLPLTEVSDKLGTIPYEILTSVSGRVKRIYFKE